MSPKQPRFNSAHVIALIALFVALAGSSYAAVKLGKNAVKTKNLASKAVTSAKLGDKAVTEAKLADGSVVNAKVKQDSLDADRLTPGARKTLATPEVLASGTTVKGAYGVVFTATAGGQPGGDTVSFGSSMSSPPTAVYNQDGGAVDPNCAGGTVAEPKANPGFLCYFESVGNNRNISLSGGIAFGNLLGISSAAAGEVRATGTWAATAP